MESELLIYLCDDEKASIRALESLLANEPNVRTQAFDAGTKLLAAIGKQAPDLVILDIFMKGLDGIAVLREIRDAAGDLPVALCSTSTEFAMDGYRLRAVRYLEKPVRQEELHELLTFGARAARALCSASARTKPCRSRTSCTSSSKTTASRSTSRAAKQNMRTAALTVSSPSALRSSAATRAIS